MGWIVGKKSDESQVEVLIRQPEWLQSELEEVIPINHGGVSGDYSYYQMQGTDEANILDGWEYVLTWAAGEITDIDFSTEESKRLIRVTSDVTELDADGVDSVQVTAQIWKADQTGIDTAISGNIVIPIITPDRVVRKVKFSVVSGQLTRTFKTTKAGTWTIPAVDKRFDAGLGKLRVDNGIQVHIEAIDVTSFT